MGEEEVGAAVFGLRGELLHEPLDVLHARRHEVNRVQWQGLAGGLQALHESNALREQVMHLADPFQQLQAPLVSNKHLLSEENLVFILSEGSEATAK